MIFGLFMTVSLKAKEKEPYTMIFDLFMIVSLKALIQFHIEGNLKKALVSKSLPKLGILDIYRMVLGGY